jgi:hypothetical protein
VATDVPAVVVYASGSYGEMEAVPAPQARTSGFTVPTTLRPSELNGAIIPVESTAPTAITSAAAAGGRR